MISIGRLSNATAAADYYLERQAGCSTDYYTGAGERRGVWLGRGATALHLVGELSANGDAIFRGLLEGRHPDGRVLAAPVLRVDPRGRLDARPLVAAARAAQPELASGSWPAFDTISGQVDRSRLASVTVRADVAVAIGTAVGVDVRDLYQAVGTSVDEALEHVDERIDVRRPGYDVVFSAPKSVSVVYGLAPPEIADQVRQAHTAAITEAMAYLELFVARGALGKHHDGQHTVRVATDGLVAAAFEHRSSRADDPQLHTHVVIANVIRRTDGQWTAVDSAALYHHRHTAGYIYQAVLRGELTRRLGVRWTPTHRGIAEIDVIPRGLCRVFSQRRQAIEARLADLGETGRLAAAKACLDTRPAKPHTPEPTQRQRWQERAAQAGFDFDNLQVPGTNVQPPDIDRDSLVADLVSADGLTAKRSTFDPRDVLQGICEALPAGAAVDLPTLLDLGRAVVRDPETVPLLRSPVAGERTYSTSDMLTAEGLALAMVEAQRGAGHSVVPDAIIDAALARETLADEQQALVRRLATSRAGVDVVVGPAGAGKTRALRAARQAWETAGYTVIGASLAAVAARELESGSGIRARSLARFLADVRAVGLPPQTVVVVDEASMIGTRQLLELLGIAARDRAKVVMVGDPCQLSEIEAGGLFASLAASEHALHLTTNQRQIERWEREALGLLRDGDPAAALDAYAEHDRVRLAVDGKQLIEQLTADYLFARAEPGDPDVLVLAVRRSEVRAVNDAIRGFLREHHLLGADELRVATDDHERAFAVGDEVVVTRNDYRRDLFNGTRARVTAVDTKNRTLRIATRDGQHVEVPASWAGDRLEHAYAMTCHRAQGITVDTALLCGTSALCREAAYVAMSRGRHANYVYATHDEMRGYDECGLDEHGHEPEEATLLAAEALGEAMGRSRRQRLAQDYFPAEHLWVAAEPTAERDPRIRVA